jgi:hypothetical protein
VQAATPTPHAFGSASAWSHPSVGVRGGADADFSGVPTHRTDVVPLMVDKNGLK